MPLAALPRRAGTPLAALLRKRVRARVSVRVRVGVGVRVGAPPCAEPSREVPPVRSAPKILPPGVRQG